MKYNHILNKAINKYNNVLFKNAILFEGIEDLKRYFPKLDEKSLKELVALDPTYKGGDQLGKYGRWIIKLFYNTLKNIDMKKQYSELLKKYPDGINPKTGQKFQEPVLLPSINKEDLYKVTNSLKQYDIYKKEIGKPLDTFKTLPELDSALSNVKNKGIPTNELALKRYNLMKKAEQKGFKKIYEDEKWVIGIPTTKESSCLFGDDTSWCTTSQGNYYDYYTKDGPLFINLDKENGKLYQFHFESNQFMNEYDSSIDMYDFTEKYPEIAQFYQDYLEKTHKNLSPNEKAKAVLDDPNKLKSFFEELKDITVKGDYVYGKIDFDYIPNNSNSYADYYVYDEGRRNDDTLSVETIMNILDYDIDISVDASLYELTSAVDTKEFDEEMKPYGITWDNIIILYKNLHNDNYKLDLPEEAIQEIYNNIFDNPDLNPITIYIDAIESGTKDEYYKLVVDALKENLPLNDDEGQFPIEEHTLSIKFPIKDIEANFAIREEDIANNTYGNYEDDYWFTKYSKKNDYDSDENNWLYKWREEHFSEVEFSIVEPYYGISGFNKDFFNDSMNYFKKELKSILSKYKK